VNRHSKAARTASTGARSNSRTASLILVALAALLALVFVPSASALTQRPFKEAFGSAAQPSFEWASTVAVEKDSGNVLVGDRFVKELKRYHADGTPAPFAALGTNVIDGKEANGKPCAEEPASCDQTPQNELDLNFESSQIAIDESGGPTDGNIYLAQPEDNLVDIFSAGGEFLGQLTKAGLTNFPGGVSGVAVDETGAVYVSAGAIVKFVPSANPPVNTDLAITFVLSRGLAGPLALGVGPSAGSLFVAYALNNGTSHVTEIDRETGEEKYEFAEGYGFGSLAVDPNTGTVLTGSAIAEAKEIGEFEATGESKPVKVGRLVSSEFNNVFALNGSSEVIVGHGVTALDVYGTPAPVPVVTANPASEVIGTKATLSGTINPGGLPVTECYFSYQEGNGPATKVPCAESPASIGEGNSPVPVHVNLSGLEPNGHSYSFRLFAVNANGYEESLSQTFVTAETVVSEAATAIGDTTATLNGTLRPEGDQYTACSFEYGLSTSASFEKTVPCQPGAAAISPDYFPHAVKAPISGLQSGLAYRYRLVATNSAGTIKAEELTFNTYGPPRITEVRALNASQVTANVEGKITPSGFGTSYRIEWGATTSYGNQVPADFEPFIGSGNEPVRVSAKLNDLSAGQAYHYRIVASSSAGTTASPDQIVETLNSCGLPEDRCFELVSRKEAGPVAIPGETFSPSELHFQAATSPGALAYVVEAGYPEATKAGEVLYRGTRGSSGWDSTQISSPIVALNEQGGVGSVSSNTQFLSNDLSCGFLESPQPLTDDPSTRLAMENGGSNLYRINPDGSYTAVSKLAPDNSGLKFEAGRDNYTVLDAAEDCSRVLFRSPYHYPGIAGADSSIGGGTRLYEWDEGALRNVGVVPGPGGEEVVAAATGDVAQGQVSEDGSRFFFGAKRQTSPNFEEIGKEAVFLREDGGATVRDVSLSQTGTPDKGATYQWATPDGSHVFFTANAGLTEESSSAGIDLYEYNLETEELIDRSASQVAGGAQVAGFVGAAEDGSEVYFVSRAQLVPGRGSTQAGNESANTYSIYRESGGAFSFVGKIRGFDLSTVKIGVSASARVSPDGRYLLFPATANVTGYEGGGSSQAYLYDAHGGSEGTICISCRQDDQPSIAQGGIEPYQVLSEYQSANSPQHPLQFLIVHDGEPRVFFSSPDSLAPGAVEGQNNIYEWVHGQLFRLASAVEGQQGRLYSGYGTAFAGASNDGSDIYFFTPETLNWEDGDERFSVYDARMGGGFPEPPAPPIPCNADAEGSCQGAALGGAAVPGAASTTFTGPANEKQTQAKKKKRAHKKKHKKHAKKKSKGKKGKGKNARHANGNRRAGK